MQQETQTTEQEPASTGLWAGLSESSDPQRYLSAWLGLQCARIQGAAVAMVAVREGKGGLQPLGIWPESPESASGAAELGEIALQALEEGCGLVAKGAEPPGGYAVAYPVLPPGDATGVVAVRIRGEGEQALPGVMEQLQWGSAWLESLLRRQHIETLEGSGRRLVLATDLLSALLTKPKFNEAAMTFVTELARAGDAERVSLGFVKRGRCEVTAISHTAQFKKRMNLVRGLGAVMDEALDQGRTVLFPESREGVHCMDREHERFSLANGNGSLLTIPLFNGNEAYGAVTLERSKEAPFGAEELVLCEAVAQLSGRALEQKRLNDRILPVVLVDASVRQLGRLFGRGYLGRKLAVCLLTAVTLFFLFARGDYRVRADTVLEGEVQRVLAAPFNGYIERAERRAGSLVKEGEVLAQLDSRDLRLERLKWLSRRAQLERQAQDARAGHDRAELNIANARIEEAGAQLELVENQLARTRILAPFDGLVVSGDLSQQLGAAVEQGQELFKLAPLDAYRVILKVDERYINELAEGQTGTLVLVALPEEKYPLRVTRITPVTQAEEGGNFFRVEAVLDRGSERLRPGMEGVARVDVEERLLIDIWTRDIRNWITLKLWKWLP